MIELISGDLTECKTDFICHQANYHGVMGAGVALAIKDKLLSPEAYAAYQNLCARKGAALLGTIQYLPCGRSSDGYLGILFNLFCQDEVPTRSGCFTRYDCMRKCLAKVDFLARKNGNRSVAIPENMGCGIAGGNWATVRQIVEDVFARSPVKLSIVRWDRDEK